MNLYCVTFDETDVVVIHQGLEVDGEAGWQFVRLGTDVGGATLANVPFRIVLRGFEAADALPVVDGRRQLLGAGVTVAADGQVSFVPEAEADDGRAFVVLSVIQRSPDARTEVAPLAEGVECVGNAFERPMDKQVLFMEPGASVQFRRFGRGGHVGPWQTIAWDGAELTASAAHESAG